MSLTSKQRAFLNKASTYPQVIQMGKWLNDQIRPAYVVSTLTPWIDQGYSLAKHRWEYPRSSWNLGRRTAKIGRIFDFCINNQAKKENRKISKKVKEIPRMTPPKNCFYRRGKVEIKSYGNELLTPFYESGVVSETMITRIFLWGNLILSHNAHLIVADQVRQQLIGSGSAHARNLNHLNVDKRKLFWTPSPQDVRIGDWWNRRYSYWDHRAMWISGHLRHHMKASNREESRHRLLIFIIGADMVDHLVKWYRIWVGGTN